MNKTALMTTVIGTAVAAACIGATAGYLFAKQQLESEYNKRFDEEMAQNLEAYNIRHKTGPYENIEDVAEQRLARRTPKAPVDVAMMDPRPYEAPDITDEQLMQAVNHLKYGTTDSPEDEDWENRVVTFVEPTGEDTTTDRDAPYIISVEVWKAEEKDYATPQLFYYRGNHVLTDSDGDVLDIEQHLGKDNLKFGYSSNDENIVYIRNDELCCDFEVTRLEESFGV